MTVFVDTFALIAWLNPRDNCHSTMVAYLNGYAGQFLTTEWVLAELTDAFSQPAARSAVVALIQTLRADSNFDIVGYDSEVYRAGFHLFATRPDKAWSLTDCISFTVMSNRGLTDALTSDHHFEQTGFRAMFK